MILESNADKAYHLDLPKVSFRVITDDKALLAPAGVQSVSYVVKGSSIGDSLR